MDLHEPDDPGNDQHSEREEPEPRPPTDGRLPTGLLVHPPNLRRDDERADRPEEDPEQQAEHASEPLTGLAPGLAVGPVGPVPAVEAERDHEEHDVEPGTHAVDPVSELRQRGDEQRVRHQHRRQDAERGADAELRDEVEAEEGEPADRDGDREPGEERRATRGGAGLCGGVRGREPLVQELPEARDDEERVVDPDAEPDHRDEERRDRVDVGEARDDEEQDEGRRDGHYREHDRDRGRYERSEDEQQHDERHEQAEDLLDPLFDRRELSVAVELDGDARRLDRLADSVLDGDDLSSGPRCRSSR